MFIHSSAQMASTYHLTFTHGCTNGVILMTSCWITKGFPFLDFDLCASKWPSHETTTRCNLLPPNLNTTFLFFSFSEVELPFPDLPIFSSNLVALFFSFSCRLVIYHCSFIYFYFSSCSERCKNKKK